MKRIKNFILLLFIQHWVSAQHAVAWAESFGGINDESAKGMVTDSAGNIYVTGTFNSTIDFDPGPAIYPVSPLSSTDIFVCKFNSEGNFIWMRRIGATNEEICESMCIDQAGNLYITGFFSGVSDFDPSAASYTMSASGYYDAFVCKLDANGNFLWARQINGPDNEYGYAVAADESGNIYFTGYFSGTADFDPGAGTYTLTASGGNDVFICKLNNAGNFLWAKRIGQTGSNGGGAIVTLSSGVAVSGWFNGFCDFDPGAGIFTLASNGSYDVFFLKLDNSGNFVWAGSIGGSSSDVCEQLVRDSADNIYATGFFAETADFNPGAGTYSLSSAGSEDVFVMKLNANGNLLWCKTMGGPSQDNGWSLTLNRAGHVCTTGIFSESVDFDPGDYSYILHSAGNADIFISELDAYGNFICASAMGGPGSDTGKHIELDASGRLILNGEFGAYSAGTADFDPRASTLMLSSSNTSYDIYLAAYNSCSNFAGLKEMNAGTPETTLFPNPASDFVTLKNLKATEKIEIFNSGGQQFPDNMFTGKEEVLDIRQLAPGLYFIKIKSEQGLLIFKFSKL